MAELVVVKFGGSSLSSAESREKAIAHVIRLKTAGNMVTVVVSAMGRKGAPYATDTLLSLLNGSAGSKYTSDLLLSCGETISACVFAQELEERGYSAQPLTGAQAGIITDGSFTQAKILGMDTERVQNLLVSGSIPVITGFQGVTASGRTTTLGRGGSDTSAVEIGGYLAASCVHIFTDVPGVAQMDPRLCADAKWLEHISYRDMRRLAFWGAGVIHHRAVEAAERFNVPLFVRSTFDNGCGTLIDSRQDENVGFVGIAVKRRANVGDGETAEPVEDQEHAVLTVLSYAQLKAELPFETRCVYSAPELLHVVVREENAVEAAALLYESVHAADKK